MTCSALLQLIQNPSSSSPCCSCLHLVSNRVDVSCISGMLRLDETYQSGVSDKSIPQASLNRPGGYLTCFTLTCFTFFFLDARSQKTGRSNDTCSKTPSKNVSRSPLLCLAFSFWLVPSSCQQLLSTVHPQHMIHHTVNSAWWPRMQIRYARVGEARKQYSEVRSKPPCPPLWSLN